MQRDRDLRRRAFELRFARRRRTLRAPRWLVLSISAHALVIGAYAAWGAQPNAPAPARAVRGLEELAYHERADVDAPTEWAEDSAEPELEAPPLEDAQLVEVEPAPEPAPAPSATPTELREPFEPRLERVAMRFASLAANKSAAPVEAHSQPVEPTPVAIAAAPAPELFSPAFAIASLNAPPAYPRLARARGWEGTTLIEVRVGADGTALALRLLESSGHDVLDRAALDAVRLWRFAPARRGELAIESMLEAPIVWRLAKR